MSNSKRDANFVPTITGVSSVDLSTPTNIAVNPTTGAVLIDGTSLHTGLDLRYLKLTGGTLTGGLTVQPSTDTLTALVVNDKDANNVFTVNTINNMVGIGTTLPLVALDVAGDVATEINIRTFNGTVGTRSVFKGRKAHGTQSAPTAITTSDSLFSILGDGYFDGAYRSAVSIDLVAEGAWATNSYPTNIQFWTNSSAASRTEKMRLSSAGNLAIGTTTASQRLTIQSGAIRFNTVTTPGACTGALAGLGAGLLSNGAYKYKVTFVNGVGETTLGSISNTVTVVDYTTNGQIALTSIPTSTDPTVTKRRIYRTAVGGSTYKLLYEVADNTTTTYTDNIADASLGAERSDYANANSTAGGLYIGTTKVVSIDASGCLSVGGESSDYVTLIGAYASVASDRQIKIQNASTTGRSILLCTTVTGGSFGMYAFGSAYTGTIAGINKAALSMLYSGGAGFLFNTPYGSQMFSSYLTGASGTAVEGFRLQAGTCNFLIGTTTDGMTASGSLAIAKDLAHRGTKAGFFNTAPVTKPTALTTADASALNTGDATSDTVIANMRTRIGELETKLQSLGLLA